MKDKLDMKTTSAQKKPSWSIHMNSWTLNKQTIDVEAKTMPVTPGLNITAEIKTGRRTVLDYLLSPIQKTIDESVGEKYLP